MQDWRILLLEHSISVTALMNKKLVAAAMIMAAVGCNLNAYAQVQLRLSDRAALNTIENSIKKGTSLKAAAADEESSLKARARRLAAPERSGAESVRALVCVQSEDVLPTLEAKGLSVVSEAGGVYICDVPADKAEEIAATEGVTSFELSRRLALNLNRGRKSSYVDEVHGGIDLPLRYTGNGVLVGIFDSGIDPNHIAFLDADGNSRVKALWRFTEETSDAFLTPDEIANFTDDEYGTSFSSLSHGTHTLGVLAGGFAKAGDDDYRGVATGSDILVCAGYTSLANVLLGVKNMRDYAVKEGKPLVVSLSLGENGGPHDGTDPFNVAIDNIVDKDNVRVFFASGNEADTEGACVGTLDADGRFRTLLSGGEYFTGNGDFRTQAYGGVEVYSEDDTPQTVYLDIIDRNKPSGIIKSYNVSTGDVVAIKTSDYHNEEEDGFSAELPVDEDFSKYWSQSYLLANTAKLKSGRSCTEILLYLVSKTSTYASRYYFSIRVEGTQGKKVYCYDPLAPYYVNTFISRNITGFTDATTDGSINNLSTGKNVMSVGAYNSGAPKIVQAGYGRDGEVAYFSSWGKLADGRVLPHILAPGSFVVSAMSQYVVDSPLYDYYFYDQIPKVYGVEKDGKKYYWTEMQGSSQAAPFMAGVAALWLEANPDLTIADIIDVAQKTSDSSTGGYENAGASGKVNAYEGIKEVLRRSAIANVAADGDKALIVTPAADGYTVFFPGEGAVKAELFDLGGRCVAVAEGAGETTLSTAGVTPGVYLLRAAAGSAATSVKVTVK